MLAGGSLHFAAMLFDPNNTGSTLIQDGSVINTNGMLPDFVTRSHGFLGRSEQAGARFFQGRLYEVLVYARKLSDDEHTAVMSYLQKRWNCCVY